MKKIIIPILALFATSAFGADKVKTTTTTTRTTTAGTVGEFSPTKTLIVKSEGGPANYSLSKETVYVDEAGVPVKTEQIIQGRPVTVYYTRDGDRTLASRVVVHTEPTMTKGRAKALREYYKSLAKNAPTEREKVEAKALAEYYDELEENIKKD